MHPLCRPQSVGDHLRGRKQNPRPAMCPLRGRHRPRHRLQPSTPLASKAEASPNAHLRKQSMEEGAPRDGLTLTGQDVDSEGVNLA